MIDYERLRPGSQVKVDGVVWVRIDDDYPYVFNAWANMDTGEFMHYSYLKEAEGIQVVLRDGPVGTE